MSSRRSRVCAGKRDKRRSNGAIPVNIGKASKVPPGLKDGQVRCAVCRNATILTPNGLLRAHRDLFGEKCWNKSTGETTRVSAPPIILPPEPRHAAAEVANRPERYDMPKPASRLDAGSECRECGKWLPGERSLCGRCSVTR